MQRRRLFPFALGLVLALALVPGLFAQGASPASCGTIGPINNNDTIVLRGNVNPLAQSQADYGFADPARPMDRIILTLKMSPSRQATLDRLLAEQQDPTSPRFHHWLSPEEFGRRFGPSRQDLATVTNWLKSQGFTIAEVGKGRLWINFSGSVAEVESAFHTEIHRYYVAGVMHHANATDPSIPKALSSVVAGIVSLDDFPRQAMNMGFQKLSPQDAAAVYAKYGKILPQWSGTANGTAGVYASPIDWATIYDANASYSANGTGTGVTIGIVGRTNPGTTNWSTFRSVLGLPVNTPTIIVNGTNPGDLGAGEDGEADLDAEWSGGVAPGATVKFVASASTSSTDGVDLSAQYIVNNNLADVMSTSFGSCESAMGSAENTFYNNLWSQAASQGITACISTGDSGPAGCAAGSATTGSGQSGVNGLASTPYDIAVGATQLSNSSSYWNASGAATGYIPETPWNESGTVSGGSGLWSTSSGASTTYAKPSWQSAPGVPSANSRYLPDVCLDGSDMFFGNYGMLVYTQGAMATTGGTSAASPSFAGLMALVIQKYGRQGNANTKLYQLGTAQYNGTGPAVFHDITSGNNNVPGLTGFTAATGWDEVTGLGTVDVDALVNNWNGTTTTYGISGTVSRAATSGVTMTLSGAASATTTTASGGTYSFAGLANGTYTVTPSKSGYTFSPASASETVSGANITGVNFTATAVPTYSISGTITLNGSGLAGVTVTSGTASATTSSAGAFTLAGFPSGTYTVTPSLAGYTFSPTSQSVTVGSANVTGVNFTASVVTGPTTLFSDGFESQFTGWSTAQVSGTAGAWTAVTSGPYPSASPHGGSYLADFNSYTSASGSETRLYRTAGFAIPSSASTVTLTFWMYHDTGYSTSNDQVQAQVSTNGSTWTNVGSAVSRYSGSTGWAQVSIDLSSYKGQSVQLGFLGISAYGNDCYIDDVAVVMQGGSATYSISGTISGAVTSGVTVTLSGAASATTTTGTGGAYTFTGLANGTYTVTPSLSGYTFSPASASETVSGSNISGVNFTATANPPATYSISGTITLSGSGLSGVTVAAGSASATTSSTGAYTISGLANGTYTVTPSKSGYTFSPSSASETVNGASITGVNFTATANPPSTYTISGTITLSGSGLSGVTVTAGTASATTSSTGAYTLAGLANGTYTVTPSKSGYTFSPTSASETINGANLTGVNFTATASSGGTVTLLSDGFENGGWSSAQVSGTAGAWTAPTSGTYPSVSPHGGTHLGDFNSYTSASGSETRYYRGAGFAVPSNTTSMTLTFWMYHDTGYSSDNDRVQAQVSTNGSTWTNVGSAVSRYNGATGWAQVTVTLGTTYNGAANLQVGFLGISAYGNDCYVDDVAVVAQTGTPPPTYSISGTITLSGAGLSGVTVAAGSATATTNSSGAYTLSGLANGTYAVTPGLAGYAFTPASASETVNGANITGVNFTAAVASGPATLFSDGFEGTGWSTAQVSGTAGAWTMVTSGTYPSASPHGGSKMADFNSWTSASGSETRLYRASGFAVASNYTTVTLTFWMYHDTQYSSYPDQVQVQVSTNGTTWTNVGSPISRYTGSTGWAQSTVDLSAYKGQTVYLAFEGISGYGNDEYLDDVSVTAQ